MIFANCEWACTCVRACGAEVDGVDLVVLSCVKTLYRGRGGARGANNTTAKRA